MTLWRLEARWPTCDAPYSPNDRFDYSAGRGLIAFEISAVEGLILLESFLWSLPWTSLFCLVDCSPVLSL